MSRRNPKQMSRRDFLKVATAGTAGVILAGCTQQLTKTPTPQTGESNVVSGSSDPVTLTFWSWQKHDEEVAQAFMDANPNIKIETTIAGPWDMQDKLIAALAAGSGAPDVSRIVMRMFYRFSGPDKGMLDLTDRIGSMKKDAPDWAWGLLTAGNRIYGVPSENNLTGLYYRTDILEEHGIEVPKTWNEFIEAGKKLRKDADIAMLPFYYPGGQWGTDTWRPYLQSMGGDMFTADNKWIKDNDLAVKALQWYYDLKFTHNIGYETQFWTPEQYSAMNDNKFATWPANGGSKILIEKGAPELSGKWSRAPWPLWDDLSTKYNGESGSSGIAIPKQGKHHDEAWEFVKFYALSQVGQKTLWTKGGQIPSFTPALEDPEVFDAPDTYYGGSTLRDFLGGRETPVFHYYAWAEMAVIIGDQIDLMMSGEQTPEQAWANIEKGVKDAGIGE